MATYEFLDSDSDDYSEFSVSAGFEPTLSPAEVSYVLELCTSMLSSERVAKLLIEGISSLKISLKTLEIVFRFNHNEEQLANFSPGQREYISRGRMQFVFYFFAKIDQHHKLGDVPFPPDFRAFITFPEEFEF